jgi:MoxR-like ATPase
MANAKLSQVPAILTRAYVSNTNIFLRGKPALGKTETINAFADEMKKRIPDFRAWYFYAPSMSPMDIMASAPDYEKGTLKLFSNEALPNAYTDPDAKGLVFFGELPNADQATNKLLQKYINGEDMSGVLRKPDGIIVVADGNRIEDKSSVQQQGRAFLSRMAQIEVYSDADDNMAYAASKEWHPSIQTFFQANPALIDNYDEVFEIGTNRQKSKGVSDLVSEEGRNGIWANMRSWERLNRLEKAADQFNSKLTLAEIQGNVGSAVAGAYDAHKNMLGKLASFEEIMKDPAKARIPTDNISEQYALCMLVALRCEEKQLGKVRTFATRMPPELQIVVLKTIHNRPNFKYRDSQDYLNWIIDPEVSKLLKAR